MTKNVRPLTNMEMDIAQALAGVCSSPGASPELRRLGIQLQAAAQVTPEPGIGIVIEVKEEQ
jgi:hypothetical protein